MNPRAAKKARLRLQQRERTVAMFVPAEQGGESSGGHRIVRGCYRTQLPSLDEQEAAPSRNERTRRA